MAVPLFLLALLWERFDLGLAALAARADRPGGPLRAAHHLAARPASGCFIALGALFLAYDGASALPGLLDVDDSYAVEQRVRSFADAVPDWALSGRACAAGAVAVGPYAVVLVDPAPREIG